MAISAFYKEQLVEATDRLLNKALVNESIEIEISALNITRYSDSITVEITLPSNMIVTRIDLLDMENNVITTITGIEIDTSINTVFSHNIQFVQGGE